MYYVYIIESVAAKRWYIGSSENPERRLAEHNSGCVRSTKPYRPYHIIHIENYTTRTDALHREHQIKRSGNIRKRMKDSFHSVAPSSNG